MVDPLDGTREFVKRNGEFTVNIALVVEHEPLLGVVCGAGARIDLLGRSRSRCIQHCSRAARRAPHSHRSAATAAARGRQPLACESAKLPRIWRAWALTS